MLLEVAIVATSSLGIWPWLVLHVAFLVLFAGLLAGMHRISIDVVEGRPAALRTMFSALDLGPGLLAAFLLYVVLVALGLALLVVPGLYVAVRLVILGQVASVRPQTPWAVLRQTAAITGGHWSSAAGTALTVVLLNVGGACLLGVGLLVTFPMSVLVATRFYESCTEAARAQA